MGDGVWVALLVSGWIAGVGVRQVVDSYGSAGSPHLGPVTGRPGKLVQPLCSAGCGAAALTAQGPALAAGAALVLWCVCVSVIDLRTLRLPNMLTGLGAAGVAAVAVATGRWQAAALGAGMLAGLYLLARIVGGASGMGGFGGGDVKLAVGLGGATAMAGGHVWLAAALGALLLTAVVGAVLAGLRRGRRGVVEHRMLPHGPSMCLATLIALAALG